mmetsp:Transcript_7919/g.15906  ORF Transcript_7919/g.15906 Transcript_7919/m.15906 type:complete len:93 (-) Transcript_7919:1457-1735(-)
MLGTRESLTSSFVNLGERIAAIVFDMRYKERGSHLNFDEIGILNVHTKCKAVPTIEFDPRRRFLPESARGRLLRFVVVALTSYEADCFVRSY